MRNPTFTLAHGVILMFGMAGPALAQIHAISAETHRQIHGLLTDHQKELENAMQQRERNGEENRRSAPPAAVSPEPSSSAS